MKFEDAIGELNDYLIELQELQQSLAASGMGFRRTLEEQGWSPAVAEHLAGLWTAMLLDRVMKP